MNSSLRKKCESRSLKFPRAMKQLGSTWAWIFFGLRVNVVISRRQLKFSQLLSILVIRVLNTHSREGIMRSSCRIKSHTSEKIQNDTYSMQFKWTYKICGLNDKIVRTLKCSQPENFALRPIELSRAKVTFWSRRRSFTEIELKLPIID